MDIKKFAYYVVLRRIMAESSINGSKEVYDAVQIYDFSDAVNANWIDENGNRVWIFGANEERRCVSFVYGFDDIDEAINFCEAIQKNEIGIQTKAHY